MSLYFGSIKPYKSFFMKKILTLIALLSFTLTTFASLPSQMPSSEPLYEIGYGVKVTFGQLMTLTPREYRQLTGHRMGLKRAIAFKMVQKKADKMQAQGKDKSQVAALLLCIFLGGLGIHRFYLGYTWQGIVQLLTAGGFGIWWLIDLIRIITGDLKPKAGKYNPSF